MYKRQAGSITLGELDITNSCDLYQPRVVCRYQEVGKGDVSETSYPLIENLQPNTTYSVSLRIVGDEHYCDTDFTDPITVTTSVSYTHLGDCKLKDQPHGAAGGQIPGQNIRSSLGSI